MVKDFAANMCMCELQGLPSKKQTVIFWGVAHDGVLCTFSNR